MPPPMMRRTLLPRMRAPWGAGRKVPFLPVIYIEQRVRSVVFRTRGRNAMNLQVKSADLPPFKPFPQKPPSVEVTRRPDGTIYVNSRYPLGQMHRSIAHLLEERAGQHP